jgi:GH24 family phage-related lysozyme (muramidase)
MDLEKLREQLEIDEGVKYEVYNDHLGYATFGVGHLVLESDPEYVDEIGTPVSESRVIEAFEQDCETSCQTATSFMKTLTICQRKLNK